MQTKVKCRHCRRRFHPGMKRGRRPLYCCRAHRQRAYELRRSRTPLALLRQDVDTVAVRDAIRREVLAVLQAAGLLPPQGLPPAPSKPRGPKRPLSLVPNP